MPIRIACPKCKTNTTLPDAARGKKASVKCGKCGFSFVVGVAPAAGAGQAPPRTGAAPQRSAATQRAFGDLHPARRKSPVLLVLVLLIVVLGVLGGGGAALWFFVLEDQFKPKPVAQNDSGGNGSSAATKPDSAPGGGTKPTPPDPTEITAEALKEWQTKLGQVSDAFLVVYYDVSKTHLTNGSTASYIYKGPGETVVLLTSPPPAPLMKVIEERVKEIKIDDPAKFKEFQALAGEGKNCDAQKALGMWKDALARLEPKPPDPPMPPVETFKDPIVLKQEQTLSGLLLTPDGKTLIVGMRSHFTFKAGKAILIDLAELKEKKVFQPGDEEGVMVVALSPDGKTLVTDGAWMPGLKQGIRLYDLESGKDKEIMTDQKGTSALAISPDGKQLVVGSMHIKFWDIATGEEGKMITQPHKGGVGHLAFTPDGKLLVSAGKLAGGQPGDIKVFDAATCELKHHLQRLPENIAGIAITADGQKLVAAGSAPGVGAVAVWDLATGTELKHVPQLKQMVGMALAPGGRFVALGDVDPTIQIIDLETGAEVNLLKGHKSSFVREVVFTPDGKTLISGALHEVLIWDRPLVPRAAEVEGAERDVMRDQPYNSKRIERVWYVRAQRMVYEIGGKPFCEMKTDNRGGPDDSTIVLFVPGGGKATLDDFRKMKPEQAIGLLGVILSTVEAKQLFQELCWHGIESMEAFWPTMSTMLARKPKEGNQFYGDCGDFAKFLWYVDKEGGRTSYVFSLKKHAALVWVEQSQDGRWHGHSVCTVYGADKNGNILEPAKDPKGDIVPEREKGYATKEEAIQAVLKKFGRQRPFDDERNRVFMFDAWQMDTGERDTRRVVLEDISPSPFSGGSAGDKPTPVTTPTPTPTDKGGEELIASWEGLSVEGGFKETWTIAKQDGKWTVAITYMDKDNLVGAAAGADVKYADGQLTFVQQFVKKPIATWGDGSLVTIKALGDGRLQYSFKNGGVTGNGTLIKAGPATPMARATYDNATVLKQIAPGQYIIKAKDEVKVQLEVDTEAYDPAGKKLINGFAAMNPGSIVNLKTEKRPKAEFESILEVRVVKAGLGEPPPVPMPDPKEGAAFLGTWEGMSGDARFKVTMVIAKDKDGWKVDITFKTGDQVAGAAVGKDVKVADGQLTFVREFTKKPDPSYNNGTQFTLKPDGDKLAMAWKIGTTPGSSTLTKPKDATPTPTPTPAPAGPWAEVVAIKGPKMNLYNLGVAASPDGKQLALTMGDVFNPEFTILDVATKKAVKSWKVPTLVQPLHWSADGSSLAGIIMGDLSGRKSEVIVWDAKTWEQRAAFKTEGSPSQLALSGDGNVVAAAKGSITDVGFLKAWDVTAKKEIFTLELKTDISKIALSTDGKALACNHLGPQYDQIVVFDLPSGKQRVSFKASYERIALSADGNTLVGAVYLSDGLSLSVWDVKGAAAKEGKVIKGGKWRADSLTLIDKDRHVVLGGGMEKDEVRVYDLRTGNQVHTFAPSRDTGPGRRALIIRTTPDSSLLLTYGTDETVRLWTTPFGGKGGEK